MRSRNLKSQSYRRTQWVSIAGFVPSAGAIYKAKKRAAKKLDKQLPECSTAFLIRLLNSELIDVNRSKIIEILATRKDVNPTGV